MHRKRLVIGRIDIFGGMVTLCGVCLASWFGVLKPESAADELRLIRDQQVDMQSAHSKFQKIMDQSVSEWRRLKAEARREGQLDDQLPVQERLRAIRQMIDELGWEDVQIMPVSSQSAVDVSEQTFSITATAEYGEMLSFFRAFETSSTWADISHLNVAPIPIKSPGEHQQCRLEVTLNFYSSKSPEDLSSG